MATFKGITLPNGETYLPEGSGATEKEWQLFQTIELKEDTLTYKFTDLDFTEFMIEAVVLTNESEITESSVQVYINDFYIAGLITQKIVVQIRIKGKCCN